MRRARRSGRRRAPRASQQPPKRRIARDAGTLLHTLALQRESRRLAAAGVMGGSWSGTSAGQPGAAPPPLSPLSPRVHPHCVALSLSGACGVLEGGHSRTQRRDRAWERLKGIGWGEVIGCVGAPPLTPAPTRAPERLTHHLRCCGIIPQHSAEPRCRPGRAHYSHLRWLWRRPSHPRP